jgi:steroid delta-isomerase-like uncharacterized protein
MLDDNRKLAVRWFDEVWNQKSEAAIDALFSPQGRACGFPEPDSVVIGPEAFKRLHRDFCGAFPDLHITLDDVIAEGDRVAVRWHVDATHQGDHLGFPATGKKATLTGSSFLVLRHGQIADGWNQMDMAGLFRRLQA